MFLLIAWFKVDFSRLILVVEMAKAMKFYIKMNDLVERKRRFELGETSRICMFSKNVNVIEEKENEWDPIFIARWATR